MKSFGRPLLAAGTLALVVSIQASAQPVAETPVKIGWSDGKTTIETANAGLSLINRLQFRFTGEDAEAGDGTTFFEIPRARTKLEGWAYTEKLTFELQLDWADKGNVLKDAAISYQATKALQVTVGQFKAPFGRQELTSSSRQQFVDRSDASDEFAPGRDVGVQLTGAALGKRVVWQAGAFNGNGRSFANADGSLMVVGRVTWQPFGDVKYSDGDFESRTRPLFAIAANYANNDRAGATSSNDVSHEILGADVAFKHRGFSLLTEYFTRDNDPETGAGSTSDGWYVQPGWFLVRDRFEIAARYGVVDPSDRAGGDSRTETGLAFSWYLRKHNVKLQTDVRRIEDDDAGETRREARVQLQLTF